VVGFLNEYFTMIVAAVHEQQGVVDKFIGDAAMAVFGLEGGPDAEDAADRAVRAALAMRSGLAPLNARLAKRGLPEVDNGIGMHLGYMVAGNIGSEDRLEYTVIGDAVNTASRLEGLCKATGNPLLVSSAIYERLSTELRDGLVSLGEHQVKGKAQSIAVYGIVQDSVGTVA
jgi:adenylate cyclase